MVLERAGLPLCSALPCKLMLWLPLCLLQYLLGAEVPGQHALTQDAGHGHHTAVRPLLTGTI